MPPPLNEFLRISIGTEAQNERVLKALGSLMKKKRHRLVKEYLYLSIPWIILTAWNFYAGLYRTHVDRVRAGLSPSPQEDNRLSNLIASLLAAPNQTDLFIGRGCLAVLFAGHSRLPFFHCSQRGDGSGAVFLSLESMGSQAVLAFALAFLWERLWANLMPRRISAGRHLDFHLKVGFPLVVLVRFLCTPLSGLWSTCLKNPFCRFPLQRRKTTRIAMRSPITSVRWAWKARIWIRRSLRSLETHLK